MVPLPIHDENPTARPAVLVRALVVVNALVWLAQLAYGLQLSVLDYGAVPAWLLSGERGGIVGLPGGGLVQVYQEVPWPLSIFTSMFLHGGWLHLIGNLWFLWIFGDNVEDRMGRLRFIPFYLLCGVIAALAQTVVTPDARVPMVGASGAIAGVLGAYLVLFPHAAVRCIWILVVCITYVRLPAWLLLGLWLLSQFALPLDGRVAWMAHVGGFVAGMALAYPFTWGVGPRVAAVRERRER
jgi:membrane associated rhomboid family serine protease